MTTRSSVDDRLEQSVVADDDNGLTAEPSVEDIEAAYARALEAVDAVEGAVPELSDGESDRTNADVGPSGEPASRSEGVTSSADSSAKTSQKSPAAGPVPDLLEPQHALQPRQVIEAALFVGGEPLTAKRLAKVLGQDSNGEGVEQIVAQLNEQFLAEARPYEIRLRQGGYELALRPSFERIRDRVYGRSPKEVKLSQEALEVLAFVAYRQPVCCQEIVDAGKANAPTVLRQLLRRELVSLQRDEDGRREVSYSTTPRFLELFGLRHIDELPLPEDLALK